MDDEAVIEELQQTVKRLLQEVDRVRRERDRLQVELVLSREEAARLGARLAEHGPPPGAA